MDEEILQDFLIEASEILEQLGEQLIELEGNPEDYDLLNAIFRGFHTIKGGAGFLNLTALVTISHKSEDVFDQLRSGKRAVDSGLMDVILQALDVINNQFDELRAGEEPTPAPDELVAHLKALVDGTAPAEAAPAAVAAPVVAPESVVEAAPVEPEPVAEVAPEAPVDDDHVELVEDDEFERMLAGDLAPSPAVESAPTEAAGRNLITEDEFEDLLDKLHGPGQFGASNETADVIAAAETPAPAQEESEHITEAEFDALLDELHGPGQFAAGAKAPAAPAAPKAPSMDESIESAAANDLITEAEFDELLDEIHGNGQFSPAAVRAAQTSAVAGASSSPATPTALQAGADVTENTGPIPQPTAALHPLKKAAEKADGDHKAKAPAPETTVRVDTETLDRMMNMVGELVLIRNRLSNLQDELGNEAVSRTVANLDLVTSNLQNVAMQTRMQPIKKVFGRFPRVVRDLARSLGKRVNLEMHGEDTDLDKNLVEALADPLVHLVRNSVDHGIETPEVRMEAGKTPEGSLTLSAEQEGDRILLTIVDDGKGIDAQALRDKAVRNGTMDAESAARMTDQEAFELIFMPGLSTKEEISDVSGRGVGMDVVKTRINQLNGSIEITSAVGKGTTISITLPLTLAIVPTLMVTLGQQPFALPLVNVKEIIDYNARDVHSVDGQQAIRVRGRVVPLYYLSQWLVQGVYGFEGASGHVVMVKVGSQTVALLVDGLVGQEEVVIKPLGRFLQNTTRGLAGATITGNGNIALILDLPELLQVYAQRGAA